MIRKTTQSTRPLAVATPLGSNKLLLQRFTGIEQISQLFQLRLEMLSEDPAIRPRDLLGQNVTVAFRLGNGRVRYFNGYVSHFAAGAMTDSGDYRKYRAEVVPWLWFLGRTSDCRIFQHATVPDILRKVFRDLGFVDFKMSGLRADYPKRTYCVQYRETDLNFVCRLMEEEGIYYYFTHRNGRHMLHLADSVAGYRWCRQRELQAEATHAASREEDGALSWEHRYEFRSGKAFLADYNFETPSKRLTAVETGKVQLPNNRAFELYDYPGEYEQRPDGRRLARLRIEEEEVPYDTVIGASACPMLGAGRMFTYRDPRMAAEDGRTHVVTAIEHVAVEPNMYETLGEADRLDPEEPVYRNQFTCIPSNVCFRPPHVTPKAVVRGAQTAVVVGPPGEEIDPDEHGRVKVQFHWDREGKRDENSSCWLRVSQKHAGAGWGEIDLPRIGEEVIVDFLEGDPDRPIITGRVYNAEQATPFSLPCSKTRSGGKTDTHQGSGYNEVTADDTAGQEQLRINAQHNMDTVIGNNKTLQVGVDRASDVGNNQTLSIAVDGSLEVGNDCTVTVGNDETYVVGNQVEITAGVAITLQCGASTIHMNQAGVITISGSFVTSAARANNAIVAPITQIVGSNMLLQAGLVALDLGAITHVKGGDTSVAGVSVSINSAGEAILMGLPLMLGEVGAPLAQLPPENSTGDGSSGAAGNGANGVGGDGVQPANGAPGTCPIPEQSELTPQERAKVEQAINKIENSKFGETQEGKDVVASLKDKLANGEIKTVPSCAEGGAHFSPSDGTVNLEKDNFSNPNKLALTLAHEGTHAVDHSEFPSSGKSIGNEVRAFENALDLYNELRQSGYSDPMMEDIRRLYKTSTSREDFANKIRDLPPGLYTRNDRTRYDKDIPFAKIPPDKVNTPGRPQPPDYPPGLDGIEQRLKDYETQRNREREWENEEARRYTQQKRDQERHFESNRNSGYEGRKEASSKETGRGFETFGDLTTHD